MTLNKNRVPSLGVQLDNDLIRVQDPHVNVGEVKMLSGKFDLFAFTCVGVKGAYYERPGTGSVQNE